MRLSVLRNAACAVVLAAAAHAASLQEQIAARLSANALKADVSFLASDALQGRSTPSPELQIAAEYIAAQFRRAGLEPAGDHEYFQTADSPAASNVAGILRGSDPELKNTYVLLTAHYDGRGFRAAAEGDGIYNGANDDASGTACVIEIADALVSLAERPKRSIVFIAFFGEEKGMLGSRYYVAHPLFPLEDTVAQVNMEQMGRTDENTAPRLGQYNATGFDYTSITEVLRQAGEEAGIQVVKDEKRSDSYYRASDNAPFAAAGVPAHTLSVTYTFPDYHRPGDEWQKLDYDNMARVARAVALGIYRLAESTEAPQWNKEIPQTERYWTAREKPAESK